MYAIFHRKDAKAQSINKSESMQRRSRTFNPKSGLEVVNGER